MRLATLFLLFVTTAVADVNTSDWKTFNSPKGDYSIQYPPGWGEYETSPPSDGIVLADPEGIIASISIVDGKNLPQVATVESIKTVFDQPGELIAPFKQLLTNVKLHKKEIITIKDKYLAIFLDVSGTLQDIPLRMISINTFFGNRSYTGMVKMPEELATSEMRQTAIKVLSTLQFHKPAKP